MDNSKLVMLHMKYKGKPWSDTFSLVQRCMEKSSCKSKPSEPVARALKRLREVINVPSNSITHSLKVIAIQQGVDFHTTATACYLTADLLYVEVLCLPSGVAEAVNVAPHGKPPTPSESLLQLLRSQNLTEFSTKLGNLFNQYSIPGNNEMKLKLLASLRCLETDLEQISRLTMGPKSDDFQREIINNGKVGNVITMKEDSPFLIQFYVPPAEGLNTSGSNLEADVHDAQVTVVASKQIYRLQMASVLQQPPQLDAQGCPALVPMSAVPHDMVPASFQLKLRPPLPMMPCFLKKLCQILGAVMPDSNLQRAPFHKLLMRSSLSSKSHWETLDDPQAIFTMPLPGGVMHHYIFPEAWDVPNQRGAMVNIVPFSHPAHVVALLDVFRQQCAFNILLRSSCTSQSSCEASECDLHFEVLPEADASFSVTFHRPNTDSLAVLLVKVCNPSQVACRLYGAGPSESGIDEYISTVASRCMSIPETMRLLYSKLKGITSAPLSPSCPVTTEAENDHRAPRGTALTDTSRGPAAFSRGAAVPTDWFTVSGSGPSAPAAGSEVPPEINARLRGQPLRMRFKRWASRDDGQ